MADNHEPYDQQIFVRVSSSLYGRILSVISPQSSVSEYVRRLLEAAVDAPAADTEQFVRQTTAENGDTV